MVIQSKFDINDIVWFIQEPHKFVQGKIVGINYWNSFQGFQYDIEHISEHAWFNKSVFENEVFETKQEIISPVFMEYDESYSNIDEPEIEPVEPEEVIEEVIEE